MSLEDFKRKDPPWVATANEYSNRPTKELDAIAYLTSYCKFRKPFVLKEFIKRTGWSRSKTYQFLKQAGVKIYHTKSKNTQQWQPTEKVAYLRLIPKRNLDPKKEHLRALIIYTKEEFDQLDLSGELQLTDLSTDLHVFHFSLDRAELVKLSA